ncbi:ATP-binding cassette domain-containing protein [Cellulomonas sp. P22]|uniref:ATP-binding cassette domain-containing protein n=1 Tax=Cellulomonas sp. P22 TaxID=3373189 RepID=UPI00379806F5
MFHEANDTCRKRHNNRARNRVVISGLNLALHHGVTALLGPNGAGKSSLMRVLATAAPPQSGTLFIDGVDARRRADRSHVRRNIGYLPQNPGFYPSYTVERYVAYVALLRDIAGRGTRAHEVSRVLAEVELEDSRRVRIGKLSGGMRQRLALACAMLGDPQVPLLDEPTVGMDPSQRVRFRSTISGVAERRTVLLSTHQTEDVAALCDRVLVLQSGVVVFDGTPSKLTELAQGRVWESSGLEAGALASWRIGEQGLMRYVGDAPVGASLAAPSIEDGYIVATSGRL